jgi:ribonuclease D
LTREQINALPMRGYEGPIVVARTDDEIDQACQALAQDTVLGFDTETRPAFRKGEFYLPSLIQLAGSHMVALFPLTPNAGIPPPVKALLANPGIKKVGVALDHDIKQLHQLDEIEPAGFFSMEPLTHHVRVRHQGLRGLAAALLGFRISKRCQCSNWSRPDLSPAQIRYAATDAWVSREIYLALLHRVQEHKLSGDFPFDESTLPENVSG